MADDRKRFTIAGYANGPGYQFFNGTRPDVNETVASKWTVSRPFREDKVI